MNTRLKNLSCISSLSFALLFLFGHAMLRAAVPELLPYQGRVAVGDENFDGEGHFKFALVDDPVAPNTLWSHDGSSAQGAEPASAVLVTVDKGLFALNLGDTSIANMSEAIPADIFTGGSAVYLRVWFGDAPGNIQLLSPDQLLAPAGYAQAAGKAGGGASEGNFVVSAGGEQAFVIEPNPAGPNIIAGHSSNTAAGGVVGAGVELKWVAPGPSPIRRPNDKGNFVPGGITEMGVGAPVVVLEGVMKKQRALFGHPQGIRYRYRFRA